MHKCYLWGKVGADAPCGKGQAQVLLVGNGLAQMLFAGKGQAQLLLVDKGRPQLLPFENPWAWVLFLGNG